MNDTNEDITWPILDLLRLSDERPGTPISDLSSLAKAIQQSDRDVRRACDALEAEGLVEGIHGMGGDENPSYYINTMGKAALYD